MSEFMDFMKDQIKVLDPDDQKEILAMAEDIDAFEDSIGEDKEE